MKQIITVVALMFAVTFTAQAQKKQKRGNSEKLTVAQQADLKLKKMTLALDLTESQQSQLKPIIAEQAAERKAMQEKRKAMRDSDKKPKKLSADERYAMQSKKLDKQIAMKSKIKNILNEEQFAKFEKKFAKQKGKMKRKMNKKRKGKKEDRK
ncbi:Spy/CpxP family protein refolding chaperone [Tenacibaculum aquimarinum]|uniref:Spy/CpxP family protein refolding chaperone n=1 Tax=Tenacibaculum aquimarinum TaxID=2910675 RepID=UPI001F0B3E83|nr:Spy/CpxP family protein refolding chaperone [Tenacibaculum aquimarinum]MCH3884374.1 Spy/CpxP family protein refolding chaperone [Tenacibaculum aquimarinum]